jgi:hypothetical protein
VPRKKIAKKNSGFVPTLSDITTILSQLKKPKNIPKPSVISTSPPVFQPSCYIYVGHLPK